MNIKELEEGMVLIAHVYDRGGRLLIAAGTELSQKHLNALKKWGVGEVKIKGSIEDSGEATRAVDAALIKEIEDQFRRLFRHTDLQHPMVNQLFHHCVLREVSRQPPEAVHGA